MNTLDHRQVDAALQTIARVSLENEKYFCDLDGEMGDADFGKSIRDGFRAVLDGPQFLPLHRRIPLTTGPGKTLPFSPTIHE